MRQIKPAKTHWYHYLWIYSFFFILAGYFNILLAWLGLISFTLPLIFAFGFGTKSFCNRYCDRGQLLRWAGGQLGLSRGHRTPDWMKTKWFRYGFMAFFFAMFGNIVYTTWLVAQGAGTVSRTVTLLWHFTIPWQQAFVGDTLPWIAAFSYKLYGFMVTSELLAVGLMLWFQPRTWCVCCPMGTLTQMVCKKKATN